MKIKKFNELVGFGGWDEDVSIHDFDKELKNVEKNIKNIISAGVSKSELKKEILKYFKGN